jgi:hypothetical protein
VPADLAVVGIGVEPEAGPGTIYLGCEPLRRFSDFLDGLLASGPAE